MFLIMMMTTYLLFAAKIDWVAKLNNPPEVDCFDDPAFL